MATGFGSLPGAGLGLKTSLGVSLPFTMDVGHLWGLPGAGCRVRFTPARCMRRRSSHLSAEAVLVSELASAPGVAWFPLAPREVFVPWYRTSPGYVNNVNITNTRVNVTQVTNVYNTTIINNSTTNVTRVTYANQHVANAVTAVSHDTFVNARPVQANLARVDEKEIANAPVSHNIAAQPSRQSVMGAGRPANVKPPAAVMNRQVIAVKQPPAPRASFGQRQAAAPNVRTEAPGQPQTATRTPGQAPGSQAARQEPTNNANNRPAPAPSAPRTATPPQESARQAEPARPAAPSIPRPPAGGTGHPLVRQAPPVQENAQHQQNEQTKFNAWQQQRQSPAPRPPAPRASQPAGHEEKHK